MNTAYVGHIGQVLAQETKVIFFRFDGNDRSGRIMVKEPNRLIANVCSRIDDSKQRAVIVGDDSVAIFIKVRHDALIHFAAEYK
jgi:hypothetical protein